MPVLQLKTIPNNHAGTGSVGIDYVFGIKLQNQANAPDLNQRRHQKKRVKAIHAKIKIQDLIHKFHPISQRQCPNRWR